MNHQNMKEEETKKYIIKLLRILKKGEWNLDDTVY